MNVTSVELNKYIWAYQKELLKPISCGPNISTFTEPLQF